MIADHGEAHGANRRKILECMTGAGTGVLWTISGGVPRSMGIIGEAAAAEPSGPVFAAAAAFPAASAQAADMEVKIDYFAFAPQRVTVKPGTTVTWINDADIPRTVASSAKIFKSSALDTKDKFSFTFATPGTCEYFCSSHPHMTGTLVVEAVTGTNAAH